MLLGRVKVKGVGWKDRQCAMYVQKIYVQVEPKVGAAEVRRQS